MENGQAVVKSIPAVRVAELSAPAAGFAGKFIGPALGPLYPQLMERMAAAGVAITGSPIAYYTAAPAGPGDESIVVHAAFPIEQDPPSGAGFAVVELPAIAYAVTMLHHGSMAEAWRTGEAIAAWIAENGYRIVGEGYGREVYLDCPPDEFDKWVTEMQVEVSPPS